MARIPVEDLIARLSEILTAMRAYMDEPLPPGVMVEMEYSEAQWCVESAVEWLKTLRTPEFRGADAPRLVESDSPETRLSPFRSGPGFGYLGFKTHAAHEAWVRSLESSGKYADAPEQRQWMTEKAHEMCPECRDAVGRP